MAMSSDLDSCPIAFGTPSNKDDAAITDVESKPESAYGDGLGSKGIDVSENCLEFKVGNPQQPSQVLMNDMALNMALPCRISAYTEAGQSRVDMIRPEGRLRTLFYEPERMLAARLVGASATAIIKAAASQSTR